MKIRYFILGGVLVYLLTAIIITYMEGIQETMFSAQFIILFLMFVSAAGALSYILSSELKQIIMTIDEVSKGNFDATFNKSRITEISHLADSLQKILKSLKLAVLKVGVSKEELGLGQAIRARKDAENKMKKSQEFLNKIIRHAGLPIVAFDKNDELTIVNDKFLALTRYKEENIMNKEKFIEEAFPEAEVKKKVKEVIKKAQKGEDVKDFVIPLRCKDGSTVITVCNITSIIDENGLRVGEVMFMRDLSEVFELEDMIRYWASKELSKRRSEYKPEEKKVKFEISESRKSEKNVKKKRKTAKKSSAKSKKSRKKKKGSKKGAKKSDKNTANNKK